MNKKQLKKEIEEVDEDTNILYWILDNLVNLKELKHYLDVNYSFAEEIVLNEEEFKTLSLGGEIVLEDDRILKRG